MITERTSSNSFVEVRSFLEWRLMGKCSLENGLCRLSRSIELLNYCYQRESIRRRFIVFKKFYFLVELVFILTMSHQIGINEKQSQKISINKLRKTIETFRETNGRYFHHFLIER